MLGFDEDDGDVIDFDNDGEVDLHKWVSRHFFILFTNINFYRSRVHIRVLTWNQSGGKAEAPVKAGGAPPPPPPGPNPPRHLQPEPAKNACTEMLAALNKGEGVNAGLRMRKVTANQKTRV